MPMDDVDFMNCSGTLMEQVCVRQRDRETERQRDRETERQRDRETEREPMADVDFIKLLVSSHEVGV